MALLTDVFKQIGDILSLIVPMGIQPLAFYATFGIVLILAYLVIKKAVPFVKENKPASLVMAVAISYFAASSVFVTIIVSQLFPQIGLILGVVFGIFVVLAFVSGEEDREGLGMMTKTILLGAFFVMIWLTWTFAAPMLKDAGVLDQLQTVGISFDSQTIATVIVVGAIGLLLYFLLRDEDSGESGTLGPVKDFFKGFFKPGV